MKIFLQLIRFPNLLIVALTQALIYFIVFFPNFRAIGVSPDLNVFHLGLLIFSTICIAAGGYIINDILDLEIDQINKPEKTIIGNQISIKRASQLYGLSILIGFIISLYLAIKTNNLPLLSLYPIAVFLLYLYSKYFKKSVLVGNIIVSLFCAFVAGIIWVAERNTFLILQQKNEEAADHLQFVLWIYLGFAFLATMFREIVKDLEDQEGDRIGNCRTLPIVAGTSTAKIIAFLFGIALFVMLAYLFQTLITLDRKLALLFLMLTLFSPLLYSFHLLRKAKLPNDFHRISQLAKIMMLMGLILLFLIA
ncbi:MAG: geranylgeranylglycerol-phosphate geranylgeranyltransferase [Bacteroidota bacterium]